MDRADFLTADPKEHQMLAASGEDGRRLTGAFADRYFARDS